MAASKTRKDHKCKLCYGLVPKGTPVADLYYEDMEGFYGVGHRLGGAHYGGGKWWHRDYYHRKCAEDAGLA